MGKERREERARKPVTNPKPSGNDPKPKSGRKGVTPSPDSSNTKKQTKR